MGGETGEKINSADIFDFEKITWIKNSVWLYEWKYLGTTKCMKFQQQKTKNQGLTFKIEQ